MTKSPDVVSSEEKELVAKQREQLLQPNREMQLAALREFATNGRNVATFLEEVIELTSSPDVSVRQASVRALGHLRFIAADDVSEVCIKKALYDRAPAVRFEAVNSLNSRDKIAASTADAILSLLGDEVADVKYAAMLFIEKCPTIRRRAVPQNVGILSSDAMRTRQLSLDFFNEVPISLDAAKLLSLECRNADEELRSVLNMRIATTDDIRLKLVCALMLDVTASRGGLLMQIVRDGIHGGKADEQNAICDFVAESRLSYGVRIRLLLECSKAPERAGTRAGLMLMCEYRDWITEQKTLEDALQEDGIPSWVKDAVTKWLKSEMEE